MAVTTQQGIIQNNYLLAVLIAVIGNLIPLYGVMFWGWEFFDIFYIYWAENVLIGGFVILRMLLAAAAFGLTTLLGTLFYVGFFSVHYGMFTFGHGMIMFDIFHKSGIDINETPEYLLGYLLERDYQMFYAIAGLLFVVVVKSIQDVYKDREEARLPKAIMFSPYGRIIVLHVTIIFGGLLMEKLGAPIWALALLIILKTTYDVMVLKGVNVLKNAGKT